MVPEGEIQMARYTTCAWCTKPTNKEFCNAKCEAKCMAEYHKDMASASVAPPAPLWEVYGDTAQDVCPVCEERLVVEGTRTCSDTTCKDCWAIAWESNDAHA